MEQFYKAIPAILILGCFVAFAYWLLSSARKNDSQGLSNGKSVKNQSGMKLEDISFSVEPETKKLLQKASAITGDELEDFILKSVLDKSQEVLVLEEFSETVHLAESVLGNRESALEWLRSPLRALNYQSPVEVLVNDSDGKDKIKRILMSTEFSVEN